MMKDCGSQTDLMWKVTGKMSGIILTTFIINSCTGLWIDTINDLSASACLGHYLLMVTLDLSQGLL